MDISNIVDDGNVDQNGDEENNDNSTVNDTMSRNVTTISDEKASINPDQKQISPNSNQTDITPELQDTKIKEEEETIWDSTSNGKSHRKQQPPMHEIVGGSSIRRYLNQYLTKELLQGLKEVGQTKPADPLKYLGEYLIKRSGEIHNEESSREN